jgi:two-component system, OmpR family, response regulator RegX3
MARILIVEDEECWAEALSYLLRKEGFEVAVASNGPAALVHFDRCGADLVLLDLMLPQMSGVEVCRELRSRSRVPIIMVSACDSEVDKVVGLEIGADDYVTKPYSARELLARIGAVQRRHKRSIGMRAASVLTAGPVRIDVDRREVTVNATQITLTPKEFQLLEVLLRNAGRVLTRAQLIDLVWGTDYVGDTRTLNIHMARLRAKIEPDPSTPRHLHTLRGVGYKFHP